MITTIPVVNHANMLTSSLMQVSLYPSLRVKNIDRSDMDLVLDFIIEIPLLTPLSTPDGQITLDLPQLYREPDIELLISESPWCFHEVM